MEDNQHKWWINIYKIIFSFNIQSDTLQDVYKLSMNGL